MKILLAVLFCVVAVECVSFMEVLREEWEDFKAEHGKRYNEKLEEKFRMKIFMENKLKIAKHNQLYQQGKVTFKLGMNKYGDMLSHEFVSVMNGYKKSNRTQVQNGTTYLSPMNVAVPESADWREQGYVTPVKDQGQCGSCWSFSATGSLEGQHFRKSGTLVSLSEQNLVDCSGKFGNSGCNGGLMDNAFAYIKTNNGLDTEASYPYEAKEGQCRFQSSSVGAEDTGFVDLPTGDEDKLKEASATIGPISIAIDASHESFQFYSKGVYTEPECSSQELDHGVLLVGYGTEKATDSKEHDYWLVKNSWGTTWGEQGYIKMARNRSNQCGVATQASYPLV